MQCKVPNYTVIQPSTYASVLETNDYHEESRLSIPTTVTVENTMFTFQLMHRIPIRRLWLIKLLAYGCLSNPVTTDIELSKSLITIVPHNININHAELLLSLLGTHDFQIVSSNSPESGTIIISGYFINGSMGAGVLFILFSPSQENNVMYIKVLRADNQQRIQTIINGLTRCMYIISVYVLDDAGIPFERTAITPRNVSVEAGRFVGVNSKFNRTL